MRIKKILISLFIASAAGLVTLGTGYVVGQGGPPAPDARRPASQATAPAKTPPAVAPAITIPGGYLIDNYAPIPGFPKLSAARKSAWEEMKRTRTDLKGTPEVPFMRETRSTIETERYIAVLSPDGSSLRSREHGRRRLGYVHDAPRRQRNPDRGYVRNCAGPGRTRCS